MKNKAYFVQRLAAYIVDIMLISVISSLLTYPFTTNDTVKKLNEQSVEVVQSYIDQKIDITKYLSQSLDLSYEQAKATGFANIIAIVILVLYFIVFQIYQDGQTLGKRLMKIRIVKNDGSSLTMNNMIIRQLINHFILADILVAIITLFGRDFYVYGSIVVEVVQYIIIIATLFMIIIRKDGRGIADCIAGTKVINIGQEVKEEEVCES